MTAGVGGRLRRGRLKEMRLAEMAKLAEHRQARREARRALLARFPAGLDWHVAMTGGGAEEAVEETLRGLGLTAWCPMMRTTVGDRARRRDVERPLFPRYVLFALGGARFPDLRAVKGLTGVLADCGGAWRLVSHREIDRLIGAEAAGAFDMTVKLRVKTFRAGDSALIAAGPLRGFPVEVLAVAGAKRVRVLMNLFGARQEAWTSFDKLDAVG